MQAGWVGGPPPQSLKKKPAHPPPPPTTALPLPTHARGPPRCTTTAPLRCLVLFSSIAAAVGAAGQANYAAANAALDAYGRRWRRAGCPALAVQWNSWAEVGMAGAPLATPPASTSRKSPPPQAARLPHVVPPAGDGSLEFGLPQV